MSEIDRRPSAMEQILGGSPLGVLVRLLVMSFVVGVIMTVLDLNPQDLVTWLEARLAYFSNLSFDTFEHVLNILVLGAFVVVPVWLILRVLKIIAK